MEEIEVKDLSAAEPNVLAEEIVRILDHHKAGSIRLLKVTDKTVITDYFVICQGNSSTQVKGLADEVEYRLGLDKVDPLRREGVDASGWILLDYGSVIVHVFQSEQRRFYNLEKLWGDAEEVDISGLLTEE